LRGRHKHLKALALSTLIVALLIIAGCPAPRTGDLEIDLVVGETASGILFSGQQLRAVATVEAGHVYGIGAALVAPEADPDVAAVREGLVSGDPLAEPAALAIAAPVGPAVSPEIGTIVEAGADGEIAVELRFDVAFTEGVEDELLDPVRRFVQGSPHVTYALLLVDLGVDDNGTSPRDAAPLEIGIANERTGMLGLADDGDYFAVSVQAETTYQLTVEATQAVSATSGFEDRFGQINFGVPTPGGVLINANAVAGIPGVSGFTTTEAESFFVRVSAAGEDTAAAEDIQYAISIVETVPEDEEPPSAGGEGAP
jgi:hypothetical protein